MSRNSEVTDPANLSIELTHQERMALIQILIDYYWNRNATQEFVDVVTGRTVTLIDLITILTQRARDADGNYVR